MMLLAGVAGIAIAAVCALCAIHPSKVAAFARNHYLKSPKWARSWPFAKIVMMDWYPLYLRGIGIIGFVFALIWLIRLMQQFSR
jgi:hypothetical protein